MKRRDFLKQTSLASGIFFVPQFLKAFEQFPNRTYSNKKVVIIQLKGGNDGLNTVVQKLLKTEVQKTSQKQGLSVLKNLFVS